MFYTSVMINKAMTHNINPAVWGPTFWKMFHTTSMGYPDSPTEEQKRHMKNFIQAIPTLLPCDACKIFSAQYIADERRIDAAIRSHNSLIEYFITFHNAVNMKLEKSMWNGTLSEHFKKTADYTPVLIVAIIMTTLFFIFKR